MLGICDVCKKEIERLGVVTVYIEGRGWMHGKCYTDHVELPQEKERRARFWREQP